MALCVSLAEEDPEKVRNASGIPIAQGKQSTAEEEL
jgi:hypothetical protein